MATITIIYVLAAFVTGMCFTSGIFMISFSNQSVHEKKFRTVTTAAYVATIKTTTESLPIELPWREFETVTQSVQAERQTVMQRACQAMRKNECFSFPTTPNPAAMVSKTYPLSVCEIYKCGSTGWLLGLLTIDELYGEAESLDVEENVMEYGFAEMRVKSHRNLTMQQRLWDKTMNIIMVRNPFARIVSAYLDKMIPTSEGFTYVYGPMSKRIWSKFRHLRANPLERNSTDDGGTASFEDFVNSLVEERHDAHWTRFNVQCDPCAYHYDYIIKFETLQSDIAYLENHLNFSKKHKDVLFPKYRRTRSKEDSLNKYFKNIPKALVQKLYEVYKSDFDLFGYSKPTFIC